MHMIEPREKKLSAENPFTTMPRREALRGKRLLAVALGLATGLAMADSDVKYRYVATSAWAEENNYVPEEGAQYDTPQAPPLTYRRPSTQRGRARRFAFCRACISCPNRLSFPT